MTTKSIKNIKKEFHDNGIFYTPPELAKMYLDYIPFKPRRVYDPTCGQGNLLNIFDDDVEKYGQELYQDELDKAYKYLKNFHGYCGNTLYDDGFKDEKFDCIVGNYPFSIKWQQFHDERFDVAPALAPNGRADYAFILHMLYHLSDDGVCVCMGFPGILYRGNKEGTIRQWLVDQNYIDRVIHIAGNAFEDTKIATCILVLKKNKTTTDVIFEDKETNETKTVGIDEIRANKYNLSVSSYIVKEIEKEVIDPIQTEIDCETHVIEQLLHQFNMTKLAMGLMDRDDIYINFVQHVDKCVRDWMNAENIKPI